MCRMWMCDTVVVCRLLRLRLSVELLKIQKEEGK
jgi:hypothetical protein